uniref:Cytochrome b561 domain-containing protein n=1 Tax=Ananas comosus var. bracteatus TaxID=296719 RepID=A0A6V7Q1J5_ANACO|nr:unnamed protein product [Ananas comosus var. bracteatus]
MVGSAAVAAGPSGRRAGPREAVLPRGTDSARCPPVSSGGPSPAENASVIVFGDSRLYLAFQIRARRPQPYLIYSVGPRNGLPSAASGYYLSEHRDAVSMAVDYTNGLVSVPRGGSGFSSARWHGLLVLLGWSVLMPVGVMAARYFRQYDPHWFYSHFLIQGIGFVLGLAGIVIGFGLDGSGVNNVDAHKALGIAILALGSLQVTTLLARPDRASKARKYWNWCHHWVGRAAIALAIGNIFFGLAIARENSSWRIAHRIFLAVSAVTSVFLEVRKRTSDE